MRGLLEFLYRYRAFELFIGLQLICAWLLIQNNRYYNVSFFSSSNAVVATLSSFTANMEDYFSLSEVNQKLAEENATLRQQLAAYIYQRTYSINPKDTTKKRFSVIPAKVISNSVFSAKNSLTIDKGWLAGVEPGMGLISPDGIVGRVKTVSRNFASVSSLLHADMMVSSVIQKTGTFCSTIWEGKQQKAGLFYVPRHLEIVEGDTILTSGFNSVFPEGIMIGTVSEVIENDNESFLKIELDLSTDFSSLSYVYVTKDNMVVELDSIALAADDQ